MPIFLLAQLIERGIQKSEKFNKWMGRQTGRHTYAIKQKSDQKSSALQLKSYKGYIVQQLSIIY